MLIQAVTAHAFGPLVGKTLELAEGMTVVYGANESAKSTWHAALYAALCGRRRGSSALDDRKFEARHRPWDRDDWLVSAEVLLDDGRRVELRQDLAGRVDCHAKDLDLASDLTGEISSGGMPDGARWLGLDRQSFATTACIAQAKMLSVLDGADGLQDHLQRAAATAGTDATAALALDRIEEYQRVHVGTDRANSVRPLRRAIVAAQQASAHLADARARRTDYQQRLTEVDRLRADAASAERVLRLHEAAVATATAARLRAKADEATELEAQVGGTEPTSTADDAVSQRVAAALAAWHARPEGPPAGGGPGDAAAAVTDREIWDLARQLELSVPSADPALTRRILDAQERIMVADRRGLRVRLVSMAVVALLFVGAMFALGRPHPLLVLLGIVVGTGLLVAAVASWRGLISGRGGLVLARQELEAARVAEAAAQQRGQDALAQRRTAEAWCAALGLPADPRALRDWARAQAGGSRDLEWQRTLDRASREAAVQVLAAAQECGVAAPTADEAVPLLERWELGRADRAAQIDRARQAWARRQALLDGRAVGDLVAEADDAQDRAARTAHGFSEAELDAVARLDDAWLGELRAAAAEASTRSIGAQGSLTERALGLPSVAEAEEELARAEAELARCRELDETLELTRRFLTAAQERAHRDIAPVLAESVRRALPSVTGGRYTDVIVDPRTLRVEVCGPARRWRAADRLSHGTAEQVFLLLRLALAGHLVKDKTSCPLLLDDVTVHADGDRVTRILELLLRASDDHQIVLFTQQEQVRDWARSRLDSPRHAMRELAPVDPV